MILRTYHISVIVFFLAFTNARTVQSATQNEVVKQPESPNILDTIHNYTYNHYYSQNPNPSFHQRPNNQIFPFVQPMQFSPYSNPFYNPHSVYIPPAVSPNSQFEDYDYDYVKPSSYYWAEPGK